MATTILIQDSLEVPFVRSLVEFRTWAASDAYPQQGRIDFIAGRIEVDISPEDLYCHGILKTRLVIALGQIIDAGDLGELYTDRTRVSSPQADLSAEPDLVFVSYDALESERVRRIPKATGEAGRFVELEGAPDLVVEIVSDESVGKDTQRLPVAYFRAGVPEFWLLDARKGRLGFQIHQRAACGYEQVDPDADGFQYSAVFDRSFKLTRRQARAGGWQYGLDEKAGR
jgi:Uma2 family endonuclease